MHDYRLALPSKDFKHWKEYVSEFEFNPKVPYFNMLVPTVDTVRYAFLLTNALSVGKPLLFTGNSGVGKSVIVADTIRTLVDQGSWASLPISFSAQTSALRTQAVSYTHLTLPTICSV